MEERQALDNPRREQECLDAQLAPVALGAVATEQPEQGLDRLTQAGGTGEFDASYHRSCMDFWY